MPLNVEKVKSGRLSAVISPRAADGQLEAGEGFAEWILSPAARVLKRSTRAGLQAVLFDLDGVLVDTAEFHYLAWRRLADELGLPFGREKNEGFRGVGRMECLEKLLGEHSKTFVIEEKRLLAERKNLFYLEHVERLRPGDVLPGARELIAGLKNLERGGVRVAVVSASRNARLVLRLLAMEEWFDAVVDGGDVSRGKPDPQGFLLAAERLRVLPERCVVVEDAEAGIRSAKAAGMKTVGIGPAAAGADRVARTVGELTAMGIEGMMAIVQAE